MVHGPISVINAFILLLSFDINFSLFAVVFTIVSYCESCILFPSIKSCDKCCIIA